ncbi:gas vesicle protein [Streptomyces sp. ERV7]|uniref:GvpL/GvpF family gas vesicle protein n=1 Tax=Streptomyces sp. ERV7 TaxID=1322334 RepID=UPI0007F449D0|nr:GvpL/GvpF family gas vesicle protein [Streptomyces sp. ERV7]OAR22760.1 gas vesicle protein [Streptomyces sp. ERV7]
MNEALWYVYAVVRPFEEALPDGVRGLDGEPPRLIGHGGLCAAASPVPAADFDAAPLRARLEDLDWLSATARAHQSVVAALSSVTCAVPLRLATVCREESGVRRLLDSGRDRFVAALERLDGRVEWGVKVYAEAGSPEPATAPGAKPATGREYLRRRLGQRRAREDTWREAGALSRTLHRELSGQAEAERLHRPQNARVSGQPGENVLNAAYLVPRERSAEFVALVERHGAQVAGVRVEVTGPWAPYSFAGTADADGGGADGPDGIR